MRTNQVRHPALSCICLDSRLRISDPPLFPTFCPYDIPFHIVCNHLSLIFFFCCPVNLSHVSQSSVLKHVSSSRCTNPHIIPSISTISSGTRRSKLSVQCCHCSQSFAKLVQPIHWPLSIYRLVEQRKLHHCARRPDCDR